MAKILLHICCGPCATACIERLKEQGHEVTLFFCNPNIAPNTEYKRRLDAAKALAEAISVPLTEDYTVTHDDWLNGAANGFEAEPEGGKRCQRCFEFNLSRAAEYAEENGFEFFTTSLTVSPHKRSEMVFSAGKKVGGEKFFEENFKKRDGFKRSLVLTEKYGLYRQTYCGCEFSK